MATKKSDSTALFPESIEQVQKSMPDDADIEKVVSFYMHQIKSRRDGKNVFYSLDDEHIVDILEEAMVHMVHTEQ